MHCSFRLISIMNQLSQLNHDREKYIQEEHGNDNQMFDKSRFFVCRSEAGKGEKQICATTLTQAYRKLQILLICLSSTTISTPLASINPLIKIEDDNTQWTVTIIIDAPPMRCTSKCQSTPLEPKCLTHQA